MNPLIIKHARAQAIFEEISLTNLVEKALLQYLPKETVIKKAEILQEDNFLIKNRKPGKK